VLQIGIIAIDYGPVANSSRHIAEQLDLNECTSTILIKYCMFSYNSAARSITRFMDSLYIFDAQKITELAKARASESRT
jgi:hypothetical protein